MSMVLRDIPKLIDEPTSGLDYSSMVNVSSLLHELAEQGKTLLVTTHD